MTRARAAAILALAGAIYSMLPIDAESKIIAWCVVFAWQIAILVSAIDPETER